MTQKEFNKLTAKFITAVDTISEAVRRKKEAAKAMYTELKRLVDEHGIIVFDKPAIVKENGQRKEVLGIFFLESKTTAEKYFFPEGRIGYIIVENGKATRDRSIMSTGESYLPVLKAALKTINNK